MRLPGEKTWSAGVCSGYEVKVGDRVFIRNRRQLIQSKDQVAPGTSMSKESTQECPDTDLPDQPESNTPQVEQAPPTSETPPSCKPQTPVQLRRSTRSNFGVRPDYYGNHVYS